jgi:arginase
MVSNEMINYKFLEGNTVGILGVSVKEGQDLEGPEEAPKILRKSGLLDVIRSLNWEFVDHDDITTESLGPIESEGLEKRKEYKYSNLKNSELIGSVCQKIHEKTKKIAESKNFCLTLGGDHGIATGTISGLKSVHPDLKVIWVDAHADCNIPEDSPSGNYHGMPVAHLLGWITEGTVPGFDWFKPCLKKEDIVYIGLRDLDKGERVNLKRHGIKCFTMDEVMRYGIGGVMERTIEYFNKDGKDYPIHISFDIDSVDPSVAYGTGTKAKGGLLYREAHYIIREAASTGNLIGMDMVEINPSLDVKHKEILHGDNKLISGTETVCLGIELISSALGEKLL